MIQCRKVCTNVVPNLHIYCSCRNREVFHSFCYSMSFCTYEHRFNSVKRELKQLVFSHVWNSYSQGYEHLHHCIHARSHSNLNSKSVFRVFFHTWKNMMCLGCILRVLWWGWYPPRNTSSLSPLGCNTWQQCSKLWLSVCPGQPKHAPNNIK